MGNQMMKAQLKARKTLGLKKMIAQDYQTQGLERMDNLRIWGSGPKKREITQGYEAQGLRREG